MKPRNEEAARLEKDYLDRLRGILADHPHAGGIVESVAEHIEEAAGEISSPEISLVQMAQILERLGPPESFVPPDQRSPLEEESGAGSAPAPVRNGLVSEAAVLLDRIWLGNLVGVVGLFVPLVDLLICELISCVMLALAFGRWAYDRPASFRTLGSLCWWCCGVTLLLCPLGLLSLAVPVTGILSLPIGIAHLILALVIYWKTMTGTADLVSEAGALDLSKYLLKMRDIYIWVSIALVVVIIAVAFVVGVLIGLSSGGQGRKEGMIVELITPVCMLPIGWVLGWFFILRPLDMARRYLRGG